MNMIIAIDFDGTCVTHEYPRIGKDIGAVPILKQLVKDGHKLILYTMRSGKELDEAVQWFKDKDIPLYGINENPKQKEWTSSPKVYADVYIDDAAIGAPLVIYNSSFYPHRPYISWAGILDYIKERIEWKQKR